MLHVYLHEGKCCFLQNEIDERGEVIAGAKKNKFVTFELYTCTRIS